MKLITEKEAKDLFNLGHEIWVCTGDYGLILCLSTNLMKMEMKY